MRILFVADGRSPTSHSWMDHWVRAGHEVHLVSTYPCEPQPSLASLSVLQVALSSFAGSGRRKNASSWRRTFRGILLPVRYILGPASLRFYQTRFNKLVGKIQPDLVHALRIPFEGMLASSLPASIPLIVSIWGNDLTLHAQGSGMMGSLTRKTLKRADGLLADAARDLRLAVQWGFSAAKPALVVPGAGGIRLGEIQPDHPASFPEDLPDGLLVVNPRGQRPGSLRQDIFFQSIPLVISRLSNVHFICPTLKDDPQAQHWVDSLGIGQVTHLWPSISQQSLWSLYRRAQVFVSPSVHDGTPNSMLEAMACGCFPVTGNIESMQEWIRDNENGLLVDATSPRALADAILQALENPSLRESAGKENARLIAERAEYKRCMAKAETFYRTLVGIEPVRSPGG